MKKIIKISSLCFVTMSLFGVVFFISSRVVSEKLSNASENNPFVLDFATLGNNNSSIEETKTIKTTNNNNVDIKYSNVTSNDGGWQIIKPSGYFYNPLINNGDKNKISGIKSIKYISNENSSLSLHYGYSLDGENIVYSNSETITANAKYEFDADRPSYFYIKNEGNSNVDIDGFEIEYTCEEHLYPRNNLKILMVGNSFADDTLRYATRIANSYGINLELYDAYIAGCTLNQHYTNIKNDNATYSMRRMNGDEWDYTDSRTLTQILNYKSWDIITLQQASAEIGRSTTYSNLTNLVNAIRNVVGNTPKLYWHQTWAYDSEYMEYYDYFSYFNNNQNTMYNALNACYESEVAPLGIFEKFIPAGTAVQNLRTSYMKDTFSRDGKHMSSVHGRYLLGLNFISTVMNIDLDLSPSSYLPNEVNSSFNNVAYESVRNARKSPRSITNSVYTTTEMANYNLLNYTEIDAELVGCSYRDSTDSSNFNKRQGNVNGSSSKYVSTKRFTSETLPVGSLVFCPEGFGYRPEAWISDIKQDSRPSESYQNVLEITNTFWSGYEYRAFNIFKAGYTELFNQYHQIFDGFRVFVPNSSGLIEKGENSYYSADKQVFKSAQLKIDSFDRIHIDPIIGFFKCDEKYDLTNKYVDNTAQKFVCTRPFITQNGDLPENTVIIVDSGYQWRSDCWQSHGTYSPRPDNVTNNLTRLTSSFMSNFRVRTFNVSSTSSTLVGQNAIDFINHLRIYVPNTDDIEMEVEDTVTMTALGTATLSSMAAVMYGGKSNISVLITLHGDNTNHVKVEVEGTDIGATYYTYNKQTGNLSIATTGSAGGYDYGTITGKVYPDLGKITNIRIDGSLGNYVTNNGSIECKEQFFDRCNYSTNAASQLVWQRWYMSGSWQANNGSGEWTTANNVYKLDNDYSMGLRIANSSYKKTRFTLKNDINNGAGIAAKGVSIWIYNPNGNIYGVFKIFVYKSVSSISEDHAVPSSNYSQAYETNTLDYDGWHNIKLGFDYGTIYNISLYFECSSSATTYVYLGHVTLY